MVLSMLLSCWSLPTGLSPCPFHPLFPYGAVACTCLPPATLSEGMLEADAYSGLYGFTRAGEWGPLVQCPHAYVNNGTYSHRRLGSEAVPFLCHSFSCYDLGHDPDLRLLLLTTLPQTVMRESPIWPVSWASRF